MLQISLVKSLRWKLTSCISSLVSTLTLGKISSYSVVTCGVGLLVSEHISGYNMFTLKSNKTLLDNSL